MVKKIAAREARGHDVLLDEPWKPEMVTPSVFGYCSMATATPSIRQSVDVCRRCAYVVAYAIIIPGCIPRQTFCSTLQFL